MVQSMAIIGGCAWLLWCLANLAAMALARPDAPHFNGFRVHLPDWCRRELAPDELRAVWFHEKGHQVRRHVWENYARVCTFRVTTPARRREQELEADDHASAMGHGPALARALRKMSSAAEDSVRARRLEMVELNRHYNGEEE